jgi:hypothetical protein
MAVMRCLTITYSSIAGRLSTIDARRRLTTGVPAERSKFRPRNSPTAWFERPQLPNKIAHDCVPARARESSSADTDPTETRIGPRVCSRLRARESWTSPITSISGWSAITARTSSLISRGRFATRTRTRFTSVASPVKFYTLSNPATRFNCVLRSRVQKRMQRDRIRVLIRY